MPEVAVIVPTHNRLEMLKEAVGSVEKQTLTDWELIVVDDASTDDTWSWLQRLSDPRIKPLRLAQNSERSMASNAGIEISTADLILFLDDDDVLMTRALERLVKALGDHPNVIGAIGSGITSDERGHRRKITHPFLPRTMYIWPEVLSGWSPPIAAVMFRREPLLRIGGFDDKVDASHDEDLLLRIGCSGPFRLVPWKMTDYRLHSGQSRLHHALETRKAFRARFIESLPEEARERGERLVEGKHLWNGAEAFYKEGEMAAALRGYIAACRYQPEFLSSPLHRPYMLKDIAKALTARTTQLVLGKRLGERARARAKALVGATFRRHPGQHRPMRKR
jgi:glycosyltransferase involved in cell wall biosynthesis